MSASVGPARRDAEVGADAVPPATDVRASLEAGWRRLTRPLAGVRVHPLAVAAWMVLGAAASLVGFSGPRPRPPGRPPAVGPDPGGGAGDP